LFADIREATRSLSRIVILQRDLYVLEAEIQALTQAKRIACAAMGLIFLLIALGLGLLWIGVNLYLHGWSAGWIAAFSFAVPALIAAAFTYRALTIGKSHEIPGTRPSDQLPEKARTRTRA
jgi:hypothetical protein